MALGWTVWTVAAATLAYGNECASPPPVVVRMEAMPAVSIGTDGSKSARELRALTQFKTGMTLGYYKATLSGGLSIQAGGWRLSLGGVCVFVETAVIRVGFGQRTIFTAREIQGRPCILRFVTAHERRHAELDDELLSQFLAQLKTTLEQEYASGLAIAAQTPDDAKAAMRDKLEGRAGRAIDQFKIRRQEVHAVFDSENGEAALISACGSDVRAFLDSLR